MTAEAVYFEVDKEKTSVDAYNAFKKDVLMNFAEGEVSATDNRTRELSKADPNIAAHAAELGAFLVKSVSAMMVYDYIKERLTSDEDDNTVYQTEVGLVYIEELNVMSRKDAKEFVHNKNKTLFGSTLLISEDSIDCMFECLVTWLSVEFSAELKGSKIRC